MSDKERWKIELILEFDKEDKGVDPRNWHWIHLLDLTPDQFVEAKATKLNEIDKS